MKDITRIICLIGCALLMSCASKKVTKSETTEIIKEVLDTTTTSQSSVLIKDKTKMSILEVEYNLTNESEPIEIIDGDRIIKIKGPAKIKYNSEEKSMFKDEMKTATERKVVSNDIVRVKKDRVVKREYEGIWKVVIRWVLWLALVIFIIILIRKYWKAILEDIR